MCFQTHIVKARYLRINNIDTVFDDDLCKIIYKPSVGQYFGVVAIHTKLGNYNRLVGQCSHSTGN